MRGPHPQSRVTLRYCGHETNKKRCISTFTRLIYPKLRRVLTQDEGTPPTKSRDKSTTWSHDNSGTQVTSPLSLGLWISNLAGYWLFCDYYDRGLHRTDPISVRLFLSFFAKKIIIYLMLKKPSGCNGKLVLAGNKHKNASQN